MSNTSLDDKINNINPGREIELSRSNGIRVTAERSGDGKTIRFVRSTKEGFVVFKTCNY